MENFYWLGSDGLRSGPHPDYHSFLKNPEKVAAIVGAGGKTTLMYKFAEKLQASGKRVLVTTTTHIYRPDDSVFCKSIEDCKSLWENNSYAVYAKDLGNGKLGKPPDDEFSRLIKVSDVLLAEADGAKRKACKVPASHEPQIPKQACVVIGVLGLSVIGRAIGEACFRPGDTAGFLGCSVRHILEPADIMKIISSENGTMKDVRNRKYYAVLTQCDNEEHLNQGAGILKMLREKNITGILCNLGNQRKGDTDNG